MCVLAHPDDESLGTGGALAQCAAEGVATYLADRHARRARPLRRRRRHRPAPDVVGRTREAELAAAAAALGLREVMRARLPGRRARPASITAEATATHRRPPPPRQAARGRHVRARGRLRPHRSHRHQPADRRGRGVRGRSRRTRGRRRPPNRTACRSSISSRGAPEKWAAYQAALKRLVVHAWTARSATATPWPTWAITTVVDTSRVWPTVWRAVSCHKTQMSIYERLGDAARRAPARALGHAGVLPGVQQRQRRPRAARPICFEGLR